jgi:type II secretory pathway component PulC
VRVFLAAAMLGLGAATLLLNTAEDPQPPSTGPSHSDPSPTATGAPSPSPAPTPPEPGTSEILPTTLPLSLVATMLRDDSSRSLATIADQEYGGRQVLAAGQTLPRRPGVTLTQVERERVLIDNRGAIESLAMVRTDAPAPPEPPPFDIGDEERIRRRVLATRIRELTDHGLERREATTEERPRIGLLAEGTITPVYDDADDLLGVQIVNIEEGGIYDRIGVKEGDVLTSVNGIAFGEPAAATLVMAELSFSDEIEVGVTRPDGSAETLTMPTAELLKYLEEFEAQVFRNSPGENPE